MSTEHPATGSTEHPAPGSDPAGAEEIVDPSTGPVGPSRVVVRVVLRDRPGALGAVASRIGAIGGDISAVDVLECDGTTAIDEFSVTLPHLGLLPLLRREIEEVDGVLVEHCRVVTDFPDAHLTALEVVGALAHARTRQELHDRLVTAIRRQFGAAWVGVLHGDALGATAGPAPSVAIVHALSTQPAPTVSRHDAPTFALVVARDDEAVRASERAQLDAIVVIAQQFAALLSD